MTQPTTRPSSNGHAAPEAGFFETHPVRPLDWSGYPALFQRVAPAAQPYAAEPVSPMPTSLGGVREAFLGFAQAALFAGSRSGRIDGLAARALAAGEAFGFTRDELRRIGCGLYAGPTAVREDLRGVGFDFAAIDADELVCDATGRPRDELAGCLVVPIADEVGRLSDFLFVPVLPEGRCGTPRFLDGPAKSGVVACGLADALAHPATRTNLVLVEDVLDALLLQSRGLGNVAAVGGAGHELGPRRWEELARLGVTAATLAFRRDDGHAAGVRDALVHALRARTAPEVFVANPYPAGEPTLAGVLRRFSADACRSALAARSLAFHDKDFGADARRRPAVEPVAVRPLPPPVPVERPAPIPTRPAEPFHRAAYRKHVGDLLSSLANAERAALEPFAAAFDTAVTAGDLPRAGALLHGGPSPYAVNSGFAWTGRPAFAAPVSAWHVRPTSIASAADVLDRLTRTPDAADVPAHLAGFDRDEPTRGVEWVFEPTARGRLAAVCGRLLDALERHPERSFVVVCGEHDERQVMLALVTLLAGRLAAGAGLSVEEVRTRLAGGTPAVGYRDKPWLADEAADRLRSWSARLSFVTASPTPEGFAAVERAIDATRMVAPLGGLFFDAVPPTDDGPWFADGTGRLADLSARHGCPVTAAASAPPSVGWSAGSWPTAWPFAPPAFTDRGRAVLTVLGQWLRRESEIP